MHALPCVNRLRFRRAWHAALALFVCAVSVVSSVAAEAPSFDALIREAAQYEGRGEWRRAMEIYEQALRSRPESTLLRQKLWECRIHYDISLRVHDPSYQHGLLRLSRSQLVGFLSEVLTIIQDSYYRPPDLGRLERAGFQSLLIAIDDPSFRVLHLHGLTEETLEKLRTLVWGYIQRSVRDVTRVTDVVYSALRFAQEAKDMCGVPEGVFLVQFAFGIASSLDRYTTCLTPQRLKDVYAVIDGEFVGIGVELRHNDRRELEIVDVLPASPALRAGLRPGDVILAIDDVPVEGESLDESANRLQGALGTEVRLLVRRSGQAEPLRVRLTRAHIEVPSVEEAVILSPAEGVGYVRITSFQRTTHRELLEAIQTLRAQGMRVLILDLRGNPGGLLTAAVDVADLFLQSGIIVSTSGRGSGQSWTYWARPGDTLALPLVVLVDGESASASEIVAGALKDHHRAVIVGERTYGKGTVQSILPLKTVEAGIRLTTAEFLSPSGKPYSHRGVEPDIAVADEAEVNPPDTGSREDLKGALRLSTDGQLRVALRRARQLVMAEMHAVSAGQNR